LRAAFFLGKVWFVEVKKDSVNIDMGNDSGNDTDIFEEDTALSTGRQTPVEEMMASVTNQTLPRKNAALNVMTLSLSEKMESQLFLLM
jgi:hypothetical protein